MAVIDSTNNPILPKQNYDRGPFKGSNGAFYVILLTNNELAGACYKAATDPTATGAWIVQDEGRSPGNDDETIPSAAMCLSPDGKSIGVVTQQSNGAVHWSEFIIEDANPLLNDTWRNLRPGEMDDVTLNVKGGTVFPDAGVFACDCVWRLDDRRVVVYQSDRELIGTTKYDRIKLAHSSDGMDWTIADNINNNIPVSPEGKTVHYRACRLALDGSDNTTILFRGSNNKLYQSVFKSNNEVPLVVQDTDGMVTSAVTFGIGPCVWIDRTGTDVWKAVYGDALNHLRQIVYDSGANPTSFNTSLVVSADTPGPGGIAVDDGTVHGLGTNQAGDTISKTDDGGVDTSWSTLTPVLQGVSVTKISTNIYTRGGNVVHAAVYDDGGTVKYNELVLRAVP